MEFADSTEHSASLLHSLSRADKPGKGYAYGISSSNRGYRLLKHGGWTESTGLGKDGAGRQYPVRTALKRDRKGLGMGEAPVQKVTHFGSMDPRAVHSVQPTGRRSYIKDLHRKVEKNKEREARIRRMLNSD